MSGAGRIVVRAPFKVSLAGEHAVGYGGSSVVAAAGPGLRLVLRAAGGPGSRFHCGARRESWTATAAAEFRRRVDRAFAAEGTDAWRRWADDFFAPLRYLAGFLAGRRSEPLEVSTGGAGWIGGGLGTSSAAAAAVIAALDHRAGRRRGAAEATRLIRRSDRLRHGGRPSGVDGAVVVRGGVLRFAAGRCRPLPAPPVPVLLAATGVRREANRVIAAFAEQGARRIDAYVRAMEEVTGAVEAALFGGDLAGLFQALEAGHRLMTQSGIVDAAAEECLAELRRRGAAAAKLTGAGAGGVAVALFADRIPGGLRADLRGRGVATLATTLGAGGCAVEVPPSAGRTP